MTKITIGARGSKLSLAYVAKVKELLIKNNNNLKEENINFKAIKTSGDLNLNKNISEIGGKNLFCKEIEESLLKKEIDIAVHSLKDMEANENESLLIGAYLKRNDYRDVIISEKIKNISDLRNGVKIGSSSKRRELQLKKMTHLYQEEFHELWTSIKTLFFSIQAQDLIERTSLWLQFFLMCHKKRLEQFLCHLMKRYQIHIELICSSTLRLYLYKK